MNELLLTTLGIILTGLLAAITQKKGAAAPARTVNGTASNSDKRQTDEVRIIQGKLDIAWMARIERVEDRVENLEIRVDQDRAATTLHRQQIEQRLIQVQSTLDDLSRYVRGVKP